MNQPILTNTVLTVLRVVVGFIFAAHGFQKCNEYTIQGTQAAFADMGVPAAEVVAPVVATLEVAGGIALMAGILARVFAAFLVFHMLGALILIHAPAGIFVDRGGFEFVLALAAASLVIALTGAGRYSADAAFFGRRNSRMRVLALSVRLCLKAGAVTQLLSASI